MKNKIYCTVIKKVCPIVEEQLQEQAKEIIKEGKQMVINKESFEDFLNWIKQRNEMRR